jgi:Zn-finger nucleic acid-binding protein
VEAARVQRERQVLLEASATASEQALDLAQRRYDAGVTDFPSLLDAQRTVLDTQDRLAASETRTVTALVAVYNALGGGPEAVLDWTPLCSTVGASFTGRPCMNCPRCETVGLREKDRSDIVVDVCPECRGVWLDRGELEKLIARAQREIEEDLREARPAERVREPERPRIAEPERPFREPERPRYAEPEFPPRDAYRRDDDDHHRSGYGRHPKKRRWFDVFDDIFD